MEKHFLFPEYVPEPAPALSLQDQLRKLQQQQQEEKERQMQQQEEQGQQTLSAPGRGASGLDGAAQPPELFRFRGGAAQADRGLERKVCQRCWRLIHHRRALRLQMSRERYLELVRAALRRAEPSLVLYMVDLLDLPDNLLPHLPALVGPKQLIVLGNKVDLLPQDTAGYRQRLQERLWDDCARAGILPPPGYRGPQHPSRDRPRDAANNVNPSTKSRTVLRDMRLISAKTGYGVEELISVLQRSWRYRGAACLVGANNASKTTLCNTLLESDYCIAKGAEAIDRATDSPWPVATFQLPSSHVTGESCIG
ncbi:LOW QUALITY PROTEIN: nitric oxide-associated protein 1-like [Camelus dromedarius]|uniref:LOW QUALITY PROTEIN: nitric oxide-associated protein 1-like n=1 Tax=Camelus dromedarius TaxID=9838 RepID=UPI00311A2282